MDRSGYLPPSISTNTLRHKLGEMFPSGDIEDSITILFTDEDRRVTSEIITSHNPDILDQLLEEYVKWWRLMMLYPNQRVVAPPPVFIVSYAHYALGMEVYFRDLRHYLGIGGISERRWLGPRDVSGLIDTTLVYRHTYGEPTNPWREMFNIVDTVVQANNVTVLRT